MKPPSEWMTCPVTQPASGLASHATRRAASAGVPSRPIGNRGRRTSRSCGEIQPLSVGPGLTALTVIPLAATAGARLRVNASMAPFVAPYASSSGMGPSP